MCQEVSQGEQGFIPKCEQPLIIFSPPNILAIF